MTQSQFNITKTELRAGLEGIAKAVQSGELSIIKAKGFALHIKELWLMEELGHEGYKTLSAVRSGIERMKQESNRLNALELRLLSVRANLRMNIRDTATETMVETRLDELESALRALRAGDIDGNTLDFVERQIAELERMI
jgi:hypothetical protein